MNKALFALLPLLAMLSGCMSVIQTATDRKDQRIHALANAGNAEAQYLVGMFFNNGMGGMTRDPKIAFEWFRKADAGGDSLGAYKLGCYYAGQFPGTVEVDEEKAYAHKMVAARAGYALAQHDVGVVYVSRNDFQEAERWWKLAGGQGFRSSHSALHTLYSREEAGLKNPQLAYVHYKLANRNAQNEISPAALPDLIKLAEKLQSPELEAADKIVDRYVMKPTQLSLDARNMRGRINALLAAAEAAR